MTKGGKKRKSVAKTAAKNVHPKTHRKAAPVRKKAAIKPVVHSRPILMRLLPIILLVGIVLGYVWLLNIPSPTEAYQTLLKRMLSQNQQVFAYGSNDETNSEINGNTLIDLKSKLYRQRADLTCQFAPNDNTRVSAILNYVSDKGREYVRLVSVDGHAEQGGETVDMAKKYQPVIGVWYWYDNDEQAHLTESQLSQQLILGLTSLVAPGVDKDRAFKAIQDSGVFTITNVEKHGSFRKQTYTLTIQTNRDAYIQMLQSAVPALGNRSELVGSLFGDKANLETTISVKAIDGSLLYETDNVPDSCTTLGSKLFGDYVAGKSSDKQVTITPSSLSSDLRSPVDAHSFNEYFQALGITL